MFIKKFNGRKIFAPVWKWNWIFLLDESNFEPSFLFFSLSSNKSGVIGYRIRRSSVFRLIMGFRSFYEGLEKSMDRPLPGFPLRAVVTFYRNANWAWSSGYYRLVSFYHFCWSSRLLIPLRQSFPAYFIPKYKILYPQTGNDYCFQLDISRLI